MNSTNNEKYEPLESVDWSWRIPVIVFTFVTYLASWGVWLLAYISKYPPFRARQLHVMAASLLVSLFWQFGVLYSVDFFLYEPPLDNCYIFNTCMYVVIGVNGCMVIMAYRKLRLYYIAIKRVDASGILFWSQLLVPWLVAIAYALIPLGVSEIMTLKSEIYDGTGRRQCNYKSKLYLNGLFVVPVYYLCYMVGLIYLLRGIKRAFNEYNEMKISLFVWFIMTALNMVFVILDTQTLSSKPWRSVGTALTSVVGSFSLFYSVMTGPLIGYLFNREQYLKDFQKSLKEDKMDSRAGAKSAGKNNTASKRGSQVNGKNSIVGSAASPSGRASHLQSEKAPGSLK